MSRAYRYIALALVCIAVLFLGNRFASVVNASHAREAKYACKSLLGQERDRNNVAGKEFDAPQFPTDFVLQADGPGGPMVRLSDYKGKVVLVNFWASWCGTCREEKPSLEQLQAEFGKEKLAVLAVASEPNWDTMMKAYPKQPRMRVLIDQLRPEKQGNYGPVTTAWITQYGGKSSINGVPDSFLLDAEGKLRYYFTNKRAWHSGVANTCIRALVEETI